MHRWYTLFLFPFLLVSTIAAQSSPYQVSWPQELRYTSMGAGSSLAGYLLREEVDEYTPSQLTRLDNDDIFLLDRLTMRFHFARASQQSDRLANTCFLLPLLYLAPNATRRDFGKILILYTEATLLNTGLTHIAKASFQRPRPYVFDASTAITSKQTINARASFVSGHTSSTAVNTFFMAKLFQDYYPDSKLRPYVWGAAFTIPAVVGYLRIRGGQHYITDVLGGYALGGAIGYLVPHWHKKTFSSRSGRVLQVQPGWQGFLLSYRF